ncbi:hypothetical protein R1flu_011442 [Riccia fluitans]|uniref:Tetratricopeptide repeat n=1 Tax=Riccia fluitans TaxID=41844 RepID=A0ABD1Z821_9MARC
MALESLPSRWHSQSVFSSRPFRPLCPGDGCSIDGSRTLLNRRNSESSDRPRSLTRQHSFRASSDRGVLTGNSSVRGERALNNLPPSPSSFGGHHRSGPKVLQRWKSDGAMVLPRPIQFEEFGGEERWRKPTTESSLPDISYEGFQRFDSNNTASSSHENGAFPEIGGIRFESQFGIGDIDQDRTVSSVEASAVDVTAPSFVRDRSFAETSYVLPRVAQSVAAAEPDNNTYEAASTCRTRPSTLKRRLTKSMSLDKALGKGGLDRPEPASPLVPQGLGGISSEYVALPDSLRKLKKRKKTVMATVGEGTCCSIKKAFDSMVFMIRALQNCAFEMREIFVSTKDVQSVLAMVQREMQSSFVWLFQQVFSCTPTLMVSVMILLANFTVFSLGDTVANGAVIDPPTPLLSILRTRLDKEGHVKGVDGNSMFSFVRVGDDGISSVPTVSSISNAESTSSSGGFGSGGAGGRSVIIAGGEEGDYFSRFHLQRNAMFSDKVTETRDVQRASGESRSVPAAGRSNTVFFPSFRETTESISGRVRTDGLMVEQQGAGEQTSYQSLLEQTIRELDLKAGEPHQRVVLDQETVRRLVAPVTVRLETDNYTCFDRTDLEYQHAIRDEPMNTMLLVNYAQFLFAVRRDYRGAEHYFSQALKVDNEDGDIWARWAIFLWLGRNDKSAADEAYQTALTLDPYNTYHASSYAHFLWHTDNDEMSTFLPGQS